MSNESASPTPVADGGRRRMVGAMLWSSITALAAAILYPIARFLSPPRMPEAARGRVLAGVKSDLAGTRWKIFPFGQEPAILVEVAPEEYRAFSATCTHLDCTVQFHADSERIWCPCHNGWYDLEGRNVEGPPPHPLTPFEVQVVGDEIFVLRG